MLTIIFSATAAAKLIVSIICTQLNLGHLAPCSWEAVVIGLNCLLLSMNSTNETLLFDRFLIMYNLCVFTCIILTFVFHCTHVLMSYVLNSYLLTYFICVFVGDADILLLVRMFYALLFFLILLIPLSRQIYARFFSREMSAIIETLMQCVEFSVRGRLL